MCEKNYEFECPQGLTGGAKKTWEFYIEVYHSNNGSQLHPLDKQVFMQFCIAKDIYDNLYKTYKKEGKKVYIEQDVYNKNGDIICTKTVVNPLFKEIRDQEKRVTLLADALGFTPVGRKRLALANKSKKEVSEDEDMFD